jgi:hypothetical protein
VLVGVVAVLVLRRLVGRKKDAAEG